jgi:vacuolar-type H+-ATPase catalytic subunit A/Vma1
MTKKEEDEYFKTVGDEVMSCIDEASVKLINIICESLEGEEKKMAHNLMKPDPYYNTMFNYVYKTLSNRVHNLESGVNRDEITQNIRRIIKWYIKVKIENEKEEEIKNNLLRLFLHSLTDEERLAASTIMKSGKNNVIDRFMDEKVDYRYNDITLEQNKMSFKEIIKEYLDKKEK